MNKEYKLSGILSLLCMMAGALMFSGGVRANDFPTLDRALYIQECMARRQSQNYETLYACVCTIDNIAAAMTYKEFVEADSYMRMRNVRGERGGLFRGTDRARQVRRQYSDIKEQAESRCFLNEARHTQASPNKPDQ